MKKSIIKTTLCMVACLLMIGALGLAAYATEIPSAQDRMGSPIDNGVINGTVRWCVYDSGVLEITGEGTIPNYSAGDAPWYSYASSLKTIVVRDTINSIGAFAFYGCNNITDITLPFVGESRTATGPNATFGYVFGYSHPYCTHLGSSTESTVTSSYTLYSSKSDSSKFSQTFTVGKSTSYNNTGFINGLSSYNSTDWNKPWYTCRDGSYEYQVSTYSTYTFYGQIQIYTFNVPTALKTVTITDADRIEAAAFNNCRYITKIILNDGISSIGDYAFQNTAIVDFAIPGSVTSLGKYSFYGCTGLNEIAIPNAVSAVPDYAFYGCVNITKLTLSRNIVSIGKYAFYNCSKIAELTIPDHTETIGSYAFCSCASVSEINIPDSVTAIGMYAFSDNTKATTLQIGSRLKTIPSYAFQNCMGLKNIVVPKTVTTINGFAFYGCNNITDITLPFVGESRTATGPNATFGYVFGYSHRNCTSLGSSTESSVTRSYTLYSSKSDSNSKFSLSFTVGKSTSYNNTSFINGLNSYDSTDWNKPWYTCRDGSYEYQVSTYSTYTFYGQIQIYTFNVPTALKTVTITDADRIEAAAFNNCRYITKIILNDGISSIGDYAFQNTPWYNGLVDEFVIGGDGVLIKYNGTISSITIPESVKAIAGGVFRNDSRISEVILPNDLREIGAGAFEGCINLSALTIPKSVVTIGGGAIPSACTISVYHPSAGYNYRSSNRIVLNTSFTTGNDTFYYVINDDGCAEIIGCETTSTELTIPTNFNGITVNKIGDYGFANCTTLKSITIPSTILNIGNYAFAECSGMINATIPTTVDAVGDYAFKSCTNLKNVTISEGVLAIGEGAFYNCTSLVEAVVPDTAEYVGSYAFYNCTSMTTATIGTTTKAIGEYTFYNCENLENIVVGISVKSIGDYAFYGCALGRVSIPNTTTSIGDYAFAENTKMTRTTLRANLLSIGNGAFRNCSLLSTVSIPSTVTYIGVEAFENCLNIPSIVIPAGITEINDRVFSGCTSLASVTISGNITRIGASAFCNNAFEGITLPETVSVIDDSAFRQCLNLKDFTIPTAVTKIGDAAFLDCSSLKTVSMPDSVPTVGEGVFFFNDDLTIFIRKVNGVVANNLLEMQGMKYVVLDTDIAAIGNNAFASCYELKSITYGDEPAHDGEFKFSEALTDIGSEAFKDNTMLRSFVVPDTLESIGTNAFYNVKIQSGYHCKDITATFYYVNGIIAERILDSQYIRVIVLDDNIYKLSDMAFSNCQVLNFISIPDTISAVGINVFANPDESVTAIFRGVDGTIDASVYDGKTAGLEHIVVDENVNVIGSYAFANTSSVLSVVIDDTDIIGEYAFYNGSNMDSVEILRADTIGENAFSNCTMRCIELGDINTIDDYAFSNCASMETVSIDSVYSINDYAFYNDIAINSIEISENLYHIGEHSFEECKLIPELGLPDTVREIGSYAFYNCNSLQSINIPYGVEAINSYTFFGCASLLNVVLPDTVVLVDDYAYYGCVLVSNLNIGNSVESIGEYAFYNCNQIPEIVIPETVITIEDYAFRGCSKLEAVFLPDSVTTLGDCVFYACVGLDEVEFGTGIISIGDRVFYACVELDRVLFNGDVSNIHELAFYGAEDAVVYAFENQYVQEYCNDQGLVYYDLSRNFTMVLTPPTKLTYVELEDLDLTDLSILVTYENGVEREITTGYTVIGYDPTVLGDQTVTVSYNGKSESFVVHVVANAINHIEVLSGAPTQIVVGQELDCSELAILVTFDDFSTTSVSSGYAISGFDKDAVGLQTITVSYRTATTTFDIEVVDYVRGDINGDGIVSIKDVTRLLNFLVGNDVDVILKALDVDGNSDVDILDALKLLQHLNDSTIVIY